jgi:hypothetical protein
MERRTSTRLDTARDRSSTIPAHAFRVAIELPRLGRRYASQPPQRSLPHNVTQHTDRFRLDIKIYYCYKHQSPTIGIRNKTFATRCSYERRTAASCASIACAPLSNRASNAAAIQTQMHDRQASRYTTQIDDTDRRHRRTTQIHNTDTSQIQQTVIQSNLYSIARRPNIDQRIAKQRALRSTSGQAHGHAARGDPAAADLSVHSDRASRTNVVYRPQHRVDTGES